MRLSGCPDTHLSCADPLHHCGMSPRTVSTPPHHPVELGRLCSLGLHPDCDQYARLSLPSDHQSTPKGLRKCARRFLPEHFPEGRSVYQFQGGGRWRKAEPFADGCSIAKIVTAASEGCAFVKIAATDSNDGDDEQPDIAALAAGGFVVAWTADTVSDREIGFRISNSSGSARSGPMAIGSSGTGDQNRWPAVVALQDGGFMIVYFDGQLNYIRAQRFDVKGNKVGSAISLAQMFG